MDWMRYAALTPDIPAPMMSTSKWEGSVGEEAMMQKGGADGGSRERKESRSVAEATEEERRKLRGEKGKRKKRKRKRRKKKKKRKKESCRYITLILYIDGGKMFPFLTSPSTYEKMYRGSTSTPWRWLQRVRPGRSIKGQLHVRNIGT
jgi:hypothetical protein